jgi:hypothetical protein
MKEDSPQYIYTGVGVALGAGLCALLWTLTNQPTFLWLGVVVGLIIGAIGDGFAKGEQ